MTLPSEEYRLIPLTQGQFAKVDAADYDWLMQWKWQANWCDSTHSYYAQRRGGIGMHRHILGLERGNKTQGDHINGDTLDNQRSNLRAVPKSHNAINRRTNRNNPLGLKGVRWMPREKKFIARIQVNGERHSVGYYATAEEAYAAYLSAASILHGEFSRELSNSKG